MPILYVHACMHCVCVHVSCVCTCALCVCPCTRVCAHVPMEASDRCQVSSLIALLFSFLRQGPSPNSELSSLANAAGQQAMLLSLPPQHYHDKYRLLCLPFPMAVKSFNSALYEWTQALISLAPDAYYLRQNYFSFLSGGRWVWIVQNYSISYISWYVRYISTGRAARKQRQISNFIASAISQAERDVRITKCISHQEMTRALGKAKPRKEAGEACKRGILFGVTENLQKDLIRVWSKAREHVMGTFDNRDRSDEAAWGRPRTPCGCLGRTDR